MTNIRVVLHAADGSTREQFVPAGSNLVVLAGLRRFPGLRYSCGMGRCGRCASRVLQGMEGLPPPNWKEERLLGADKLAEGYRLLCQLYLNSDVEVVQDPVPVQPAWKRQGTERRDLRGVRVE